ncbi:MAG TPA: histidine kinase dimerization/phosphoacceptor domain -containing protein [Microvirga sp.]|jgi:two-component sensor histidine kinase|nr:histidine kinase dimerization/phosphoacceptor domain -containing protein [Microvirga sp.]
MEPRRILLVDDDPDIRDLVRRTLSQEFPSSEFREATDPGSLEAALEAWLPDVLVTDFDLRWSDGLVIYDQVKGAAPACCTVMFTGTGDEDLAVRAMKHGFDDYVVKRSNQLKRLAASVRLAYDRHRQRRDLAENRDLVLKELYHRLHNNLQLVISLLRITERAMADPTAKQQLADVGRRIQALTTLQEQFYRSEDFRSVEFDGYLRALATDLAGLAGGRVALKMEIGSLNLPIDLAVPLGLIANELITNALKHAFPGERLGELKVELWQEDRVLVLRVADNGVGSTAEAAQPSGLGSKLVERLSQQIEANVQTLASSGGTTSRVEVPL